MDIQDPIKTTVEEIRKVLNIENVIGEVIETEDKVMIPVTKFGMAFGAGMGERGTNGQNGGAGAGGGAGIEPVAMVVVFKGVSGPDGVKVLSLKSADPLARAISEVGSTVMDIVKESRKSKDSATTEKKEEPTE